MLGLLLLILVIVNERVKFSRRRITVPEVADDTENETVPFCVVIWVGSVFPFTLVPVSPDWRDILMVSDTEA